MSDRSKANALDCRIQSSEPLDNKDAQWIRLRRIHYVDPLGRDRSWESAERTSRPPDAVIDGVSVMAVIEPSSGCPEIVLQKQFRPPVGKVCIELPAGLIDANEDAETCAIRELKEETGYVGTVSGSGSKERVAPGIIYNDPGLTNTNLIVVHVDIDQTVKENWPEHLQPELEDSEFIETFTVPLASLWDQCRILEAQGFAIDARVGTIAEGIELAKKWKLTG